MKQSTIELLLTLFFAVLGLLFLVWGMCQVYGICPYMTNWSDLASFYISFCFLSCAWMLNIGRKNQGFIY